MAEIVEGYESRVAAWRWRYCRRPLWATLGWSYVLVAGVADAGMAIYAFHWYVLVPGWGWCLYLVLKWLWVQAE